MVGRAVVPFGAQNFGLLLSHGFTPGQIAAAVVNSTGALTGQVMADYATFLGCAGDAQGLQN